MNFINKEKMHAGDIKDYLNFGEWKTQLADKSSNINKLLKSIFFVDPIFVENDEAIEHRVDF